MSPSPQKKKIVVYIEPCPIPPGSATHMQKACQANIFISSFFFNLFWLICCCACCEWRALFIYLYFYLYIFNLMCHFKLLPSQRRGAQELMGRVQNLRFIVSGCTAARWEPRGDRRKHWIFFVCISGSSCMHELSICAKVAKICLTFEGSFACCIWAMNLTEISIRMSLLKAISLN